MQKRRSRQPAASCQHAVNTRKAGPASNYKLLAFQQTQSGALQTFVSTPIGSTAACWHYAV
nr:hypothetical protein [Cellvibrionaceae bacterium]